MVRLTYETRGELVENEHYGTICVVSERGVEYTAVNADSDITSSERDSSSEKCFFFRSSSKPIQALPVLLLGLDKKYGLTDAECAIMAGSNAGEKYCTDVVETMMKKTGITEDELVMRARYPSHEKTKISAYANGEPPKKIWHGCTPKHIGAILVQRELTGSGKGYERPDSAAQRLVRYVISMFTDTKYEDIKLGCDGCGVPVFGVPAVDMARSYLKLAVPQLLPDRGMAAAAERIVTLMHKYPQLIRGNEYLCTLLNSYDNICAKGGSSGVYCFGLKKERLGVMLKLYDGTETSWQPVIAEILRCISPEINADVIRALDEKELLGTVRREIYNMTGSVIGELGTSFTLEKK